jgi:hypothetical protein
VFYAGGGAGGGYKSENIGSSGGGLSGNGHTPWGYNNPGEIYNAVRGGDAKPNTGGGGGGISYGAGTATLPGSGGAGIVVIRYPETLDPPASFGGSNTPQILYADGYQIYIWTASGTVTF